MGCLACSLGLGRLAYLLRVGLLAWRMGLVLGRLAWRFDCLRRLVCLARPLGLGSAA